MCDQNIQTNEAHCPGPRTGVRVSWSPLWDANRHWEERMVPPFKVDKVSISLEQLIATKPLPSEMPTSRWGHAAWHRWLMTVTLAMGYIARYWEAEIRGS
jgi:hypothetical protein